MGDTAMIITWSAMLVLIGGEIIRAIFMFKH